MVPPAPPPAAPPRTIVVAAAATAHCGGSILRHLGDANGVTVIVDPKSLRFLDGTELDFAREGLNEGFKFNNPNVKDACGCGESFNV